MSEKKVFFFKNMIIFPNCKHFFAKNWNEFYRYENSLFEPFIYLYIAKSKQLRVISNYPVVCQDKTPRFYTYDKK